MSDALRLGPLLRYVDETRATVWVETDRACEVEVLGHTARTWSVHGHHYALVRIEGLEPDSETEYEVRLDGELVWPSSDPEFERFGPSVIRTAAKAGPFRLSFGSCRRAEPLDENGRKDVGPDALAGLAERLTHSPRSTWPDALLLLGDQVYADDPSEAVLDKIRAAHTERDDEISDEIANYEEYTWLYDDSWTPAPVRWLLSTVPVCMLLDDHDLRDDWNTSRTWRDWATSQPWWRDRVVGAYASYWVYQHLGNLSPEQLDQDEVYAAMLAGDGEDEGRTTYLDEFAWRADTEPETVRWSFYRDLGDPDRGFRLVAIDSRCSRRLDPDDRAMVDADEWAWIRKHTVDADHRIRHLLLASTLPFLLAPGLHHLEGWDEAVAQGAWGGRAGVVGEKIRQALDLEHWAAFRSSLDDVTELLGTAVSQADPPASVLMLSGDVHTSYIAGAQLHGYAHPQTAIHQLTMSPFRNPVGRDIHAAYRLFTSRGMSRALRRLARSAGVRDTAMDWDVDHGPWFDNGVMTILMEGDMAAVEVDHASLRHRSTDRLRRTAAVLLAPKH